MMVHINATDSPWLFLIIAFKIKVENLVTRYGPFKEPGVP